MIPLMNLKNPLTDEGLWHISTNICIWCFLAIDFFYYAATGNYALYKLFGFLFVKLCTLSLLCFVISLFASLSPPALAGDGAVDQKILNAPIFKMFPKWPDFASFKYTDIKQLAIVTNPNKR